MITNQGSKCVVTMPVLRPALGPWSATPCHSYCLCLLHPLHPLHPVTACSQGALQPGFVQKGGEDGKPVSDQWLPPFVIVDDDKKPVGTVEDGDAVVSVPQLILTAWICWLNALCQCCCCSVARRARQPRPARLPTHLKT